MRIWLYLFFVHAVNAYTFYEEVACPTNVLGSVRKSGAAAERSRQDFTNGEERARLYFVEEDGYEILISELEPFAHYKVPRLISLVKKIL